MFFRRLVLIASRTWIFWRVSLKFELFWGNIAFPLSTVLTWQNWTVSRLQDREQTSNRTNNATQEKNSAYTSWTWWNFTPDPVNSKTVEFRNNQHPWVSSSNGFARANWGLPGVNISSHEHNHAKKKKYSRMPNVPKFDCFASTGSKPQFARAKPLKRKRERRYTYACWTRQNSTVSRLQDQEHI